MVKIKTHDTHPGKHGDRGEVTKVSNGLTEIFVLKIKIENCEEESCQEYYADNIAQDNLSMEIVEVRDDPIDNETITQSDKTDKSKDGKIERSHHGIFNI